MARKHVEPAAVHAAVAGRPVRLGKQAPKIDKRTLQMARYLIDPKTGKKVTVAKLPPLKGSVVRSQLVPSWGMMGNDQYGDCTCAAVGHAEQITSAVVSDGTAIHTPTDSDVLGAYWATGNPPTPGADDNGRAELDVLNYWRTSGIGGSKITAFASLGVKKAATIQKETKYAIDLFGFCYIGVALPISAQSQAVWTPVRGASGAPGSWGGHAIILVDYDSKGPSCVTWGEIVKMSWAFYAKYTDEAYIALAPEWMNAQGESPAGFNVQALMDDLHSITG
jgi:hypothetical protein